MVATKQKIGIFSLLLVFSLHINAQVVQDTIPSSDTSFHIPVPVDTVLRINNLTPFFNVAADSILNYQLLINKNPSNYFWFLKNPVVGLKINKDNGLLTFKAEKNYFMNGRLKYDVAYPIHLVVQNLSDPTDKIDTSFTIVFFNNEVIYPKVKLSVSDVLRVNEGDLVSFKVQCEAGNFTIDNILFTSDISLTDYKMVSKCGDEFIWTPPFDFVKETDSAKVKIINLSFIGVSRFKTRDTAMVKIIVKDALNYPLALEEYKLVKSNLEAYILSLKYTFLQVDKTIKKTKSMRTGFDLTSASTALTGTILTTSGGSDASKNTGKVLPSVGIALVPVKEATAPNKIIEQNQASLIRSSIKRLQYMLFDYAIIGERDPAIATKIAKLKEELKQTKMQLIDIPLDVTENMSEAELNDYFNNSKVNKKYRLKKK